MKLIFVECYWISFTKITMIKLNTTSVPKYRTLAKITGIKKVGSSIKSVYNYCCFYKFILKRENWFIFLTQYLLLIEKKDAK